MIVKVDIMEIRAGVKAGYFRTTVENNIILMEDTVSGERIKIGDVPAEKEGHWNWRKADNGEPECICSQCGKHAPYAEDGRVDMALFCHHCGSRNGGGGHG